MTKFEAVVQALVGLLAEALPMATVRRDDALPADIPSGILVVVPDGAIEPDDELLGSAGPWIVTQRIVVEIAVKGGVATARDAQLDAAVDAVDTALAADLTMGGHVDGLRWTRIGSEAEPFPGASGVKIGSLEIELEYQSLRRV